MFNDAELRTIQQLTHRPLRGHGLDNYAVESITYRGVLLAWWGILSCHCSYEGR
jgi:hypothetical protein